MEFTKLISSKEDVNVLLKHTEDKYNRLTAAQSITEINAADVVRRRSSGFYYYKILGVSNCWEDSENGISEIMSRIFMGLHAVAVPFSMVVQSDGIATNVYFGAEPVGNVSSDRVLLGLLNANLPSVSIQKSDLGSGYDVYTFDRIVNSDDLRVSGFIKGNPSFCERGSQVDSIVNGMKNKPWCYVICAAPVCKPETVHRQRSFLNEATVASSLQEVSYSGTDNRTNTSYKETYSTAQKFYEKMEQYCEKYENSVNTGEWNVTVQYAARNESDAELLAGLMTSAFYGEASKPEATRRIKCHGFCLTDSVVERNDNSIIPGFAYPIISNYLSSNELAVYASVPTVDTAGFAVRNYVSFDVAHSKTGSLDLGEIMKNGGMTGSHYLVKTNELNRHGLIVGLTGSGKTNTTKNILNNVYKTSGGAVSIMVIEPAKKEYWELYKMGFDDLQIYSVGSTDPKCNPYCLNPFEKVGNISLQTHIDNVYAAFKASFIMYTPMPYILERAIYEIYEDYGWDLKTNTNTKGTDLYPTVEDLYWKIPVVIEDMGYDQKMRNDLIGSMQARINSLRLGSKGDTLNVRKSYPIGEILKKNVVIELEDIGDDDVKAFIISMLLIQLVEYRRQQEDCQLEVRHLMLIEEAHRLLKNVSSGTGENADPRGAAVEFFCNLLAELRSKGQGFLIADQIPSKLAPDLIKNTNIKIVHRTVDKQDRDLMGGAMHMTDEQTDYLSSLRMGESAIYSEGDNRPKMVKPEYAGRHIPPEKKHLKTEADVLELVRKNCYLSNSAESGMYYRSLTDYCLMCRLSVPYCMNNPDVILQRVNLANLDKFMKKIFPENGGTVSFEDAYTTLSDIVDESPGAMFLSEQEKGCLKKSMFNYAVNKWSGSEKDKQRLIRNYAARYKCCEV